MRHSAANGLVRLFYEVLTEQICEDQFQDKENKKPDLSDRV